MNGYNSKEDHLSGSNFHSPLSSGRRGRGAGGWDATLSEGIHSLLVEASLTPDNLRHQQVMYLRIYPIAYSTMFGIIILYISKSPKSDLVDHDSMMQFGNKRTILLH